MMCCSQRRSGVRAQRAVRRRLAAMAAGLAVSLGIAQAVVAQPLFGTSRHGRMSLTREDLGQMNQAAAKLQPEIAPTGQVETWSNPRSGTSGKVTLLQTFRADNMACRKLRYEFSNPRQADGATYVLDSCRLPDGQWKYR